MEEFRKILSRVGAAPEGARALSAECYRDPAFFAAEREHVLRPGWHAVARREELPEPGDYRSVDVAGDPLILVRDERGQLRAYSRVCAHRASIFVQGEGNTRRFVCPYHRWSYDLDGRLAAAPLMEDVADFDRESCRLPELPVCEWQGFVFVSCDPQAPALAPQLAPLDKALDEWGMADLRIARTLEYDSPWNWKVMVENFIESYHHMGGHPKSLQRSNPAAGTYRERLDGPFAMLENPAVEGSAPFWVFGIYPTLLFALQRGDPPFAFWYEMHIDRHDHLLLRVHGLMPAAALAASSDAELDAFAAGIDAIHQEDIPLCEGVQAGLQSHIWQPGRLSGQEETLWHFHRWLADRLLPALD